MDNVWIIGGLWIGLAFLASLLSIRLGISIALLEIMVGAVSGNTIGLPLTPWINHLAGVGAILLTFLAGAEIDPEVIRKHLGSSLSIGIVGFFAPFLGVFGVAYWLLDWPVPQALIAGISLSTTSVAVVFAVMLETGLNRTEIGKIILAACFINDLGTVLVLGVAFANYNAWLALFAGATAVVMWMLPKFAPWFFARVGSRVSEPEIKFILLVLFFLGGLSSMAKSEAVLPAYLIGMALAPYFLKERTMAQRMRVLAFTLLTPFYFLKAGALIQFGTIFSMFGLIVLFLCIKMLTKSVGIWPLTRVFRFEKRQGVYTTLMMSTGLTFGSISALFGLNNGIINEEQYTVLVTAVIASAVVPTLIAEQWFRPEPEILREEQADAQENTGRAGRLAGIVQGSDGSH